MKKMIVNGEIWFFGVAATLILMFILSLSGAVSYDIYEEKVKHAELKAKDTGTEVVLPENKYPALIAGKFVVDNFVYIISAYIGICVFMHIFSSVLYTFRPEEPKQGRYVYYRDEDTIEYKYRRFVYICTFAGPSVLATMFVIYVFLFCKGIVNFLPKTLEKAKEKALTPPKLPHEKTAFSSPEEERLFKEFMAMKKKGKNGTNS